MKILWIDDYPGRKSTADDLGAEFINVQGEDLAPVVDKLLRGSSPSLVIIDHILDKTASGTNAIFRKGSTIAEAIKAEWPHCPVVGVTNIDNINGIDIRTKRAYDALFRFHHFSKYFDRIKGMAKGFMAVKKVGSNDLKLIELLKPPKYEVDRINAALSDDLKMPTQDASVGSRMFRWVERLMDRPGFLFDSLWSATLLGLNEDGFSKVVSRFEEAMYKGIFPRPDEPRWWSSRLSELLYGLCRPEPGELSWHVGRRLESIRKSHFSSCYSCGEDYPEIVAYLDETTEQRQAMHLRCTILHPRHKRELFFEDIRMLGGK